MSDLVFKRTIRVDPRGYFRLALPPEIGRLLGGGPVGVSWRDGEAVIRSLEVFGPGDTPAVDRRGYINGRE
jgi:hypothetical protein